MVLTNGQGGVSLAGAFAGLNAGLTNADGSALASLTDAANAARWLTNAAPQPFERPFLGWSDWGATTTPYWNTLDPTLKSATTISNYALVMVTNGLLAAGWNIIAVDAGWEAPTRDANGNLQGSTNFTDIPGLVSWLHGLGFQVMWYLSRGFNGCGLPDQPGTWGYELQDLARLDSWGIDAVKLDECGGACDPSTAGVLLYNQALNPPNTSKSIFSLWTLGYLNSGWPSYCNCPQNAQAEVISTYSGTSSNYAWTHLVPAIQDQADGNWLYWGSTPPTPSLYGPYHFKNSSVLCGSNSPNVLLTGFALLTAVLNNPMLIDFPPTNNLAIWTNQEIIAIMQDEACRMGVNVTNYANGVQVWVKSLGLPEKCRAVCYFNTNPFNVTISGSIQDMGYIGQVSIRDAINHVNLGSFSMVCPAVVPAASCLLWLVTPTANTAAVALTAVNAPGSTPATVTNGGLVWYVTNNTPTASLPDGSISTTTDGRFFVRSNKTWVLH